MKNTLLYKTFIRQGFEDQKDAAEDALVHFSRNDDKDHGYIMVDNQWQVVLDEGQNIIDGTGAAELSETLDNVLLHRQKTP